MTKAGKHLIESLEEAARIARGAIPAARLFLNGHYYVPEERLELIREALEVARLDFELRADSSIPDLHLICDALAYFKPPSA